MTSSTCASTSPRIVTPSQATVVALTSTSSPGSSPSSETRNRSGSIVPLQRLECVRVAKKLRRNGHRLYVAAVYLQRSEARRRLSEVVYQASPASKLSPDAMHAVMMAEREPNYTVERRFSEFRELRADVAALVRANEEHAKRCGDCQDLQQVMRSSKHQNWTVKRMVGGREQRFLLLTVFLNDLLTLTASANGRTNSENLTEEMVDKDKDCYVRKQIATLLQNFLRRKLTASTGII